MTRLITERPVSGRSQEAKQFRCAGRGHVIHQHDNQARTVDEVHGAPDALDHGTRHHPVGEVTVHGNLHAAPPLHLAWNDPPSHPAVTELA